MARRTRTRWGIHSRVDSRLAEMQLRIPWEELLKRYRLVEVGGEPMRVRSNFVKGFHRLPVRLHTHGWRMDCVRTGHALTDWHELDLVD